MLVVNELQLILIRLFQVLNRCLEPKQAEVPPQLPLVTPVAPVTPQVAQVPQVAVPILPQHVITSGTRKDCIRLRGLPYEAQVEHILEFLGEHAKNIVYQGVHMVYNAQVSPTFPYCFLRMLLSLHYFGAEVAAGKVTL